MFRTGDRIVGTTWLGESYVTARMLATGARGGVQVRRDVGEEEERVIGADC